MEFVPGVGLVGAHTQQYDAAGEGDYGEAADGGYGGGEEMDGFCERAAFGDLQAPLTAVAFSPTEELVFAGWANVSPLLGTAPRRAWCGVHQ